METKFASLELHGYKTFARQTTLEFPSRITAIVGPNGSGKSNVADAIRWVLGEQSYSLLRAKKTEDMIYIGSDQRARAGMASVSIKFDNANGWLPIDYAEVVLTRRAYRDGQNEYLLNNQRVRLKDFHELLAKTGLSDRTYTIIGQGLVDVALSIKPDERRKLFEEAAGIGLYRSRKEEALRRLEKTERNLERARDIVDEIRPRVRSLERQALRVSEFKAVQQGLQKNLREWYGYHWYKVQEDIAMLRSDLADAETLSEKSAGLVQRNETALQELQSKINGQRQKVNELIEETRALHDSIQSRNQAIAILEERKRAAAQSRHQLDLDLVNLDEMVASDQSALLTAQTELAQAEAELKLMEGRYSAADVEIMEKRAYKRDLDKQRYDLQNQLNQAERDELVQKSRSVELAERLERLARTLESKRDSAKGFGTEEQEYRRVLAEQSQQLGELEDGIAGLEAQRQETHDKQADLRKQMEENAGHLNRANLEKNKQVNKLDLLNQAQESLAGFSVGAKAILKHQKLKAGVTDLATKLELAERYEKAIAAALGEAIDVLVVQDRRIDANFVRQVNSEISERVALISASGETQPEPAPVPAAEGVEGIAADLVQNAGDLKPLVKALLYDYLVVENAGRVFTLPADVRKRFNIVTLDGEVFLKNGVTLLGKSNAGSKVSYNRVRKELESQISGTDENLRNFEELGKQFRQRMTGYEQILEGIQKHERFSNAALLALRAKSNTANLNLERVLGNQRLIEEQVQESTQLIASAKQEQEALKGRLAKRTAEIEALRLSLRDLKEQQSAANLDELEQNFQFLATEKKMMAQAVVNAKQRCASLQQRLESDQTRLEAYKVRQRESESVVSELDGELSQTRTALRETDSEAETLRVDQLEPQSSLLAKLEQEYQQLSSLEGAVQKDMAEKERQLTHFQLEMGRRQERLETLRARIEDDFGLIELEYRSQYAKSTPLPFPDLVIESLPETAQLPDRLEENIKEQKAQIRRIGTVNIEAEAEYHEVKARYESLTTQISDLTAAIADIQRINQELDEIMQQEFLATFKLVSAEFSKMFARLFGGGSARLILSDEDAPIEGGIDIEAKLPGKREQGLVLLSGGERSLTAVALVFALLKISPTPFCVLDEVDAMLDESNVGRFIELLKDLSEETQFLLITHNRNTVQAADVIYGVTMGKDSASQVISLMLEDVDDSFVK